VREQRDLLKTCCAPAKFTMLVNYIIIALGPKDKFAKSSSTSNFNIIHIQGIGPIATDLILNLSAPAGKWPQIEITYFKQITKNTSFDNLTSFYFIQEPI
jgi:hypothetical protein